MVYLAILAEFGSWPIFLQLPVCVALQRALFTFQVGGCTFTVRGSSSRLLCLLLAIASVTFDLDSSRSHFTFAISHLAADNCKCKKTLLASNDAAVAGGGWRRLLPPHAVSLLSRKTSSGTNGDTQQHSNTSRHSNASLPHTLHFVPYTFFFLFLASRKLHSLPFIPLHRSSPLSLELEAPSLSTEYPVTSLTQATCRPRRYGLVHPSGPLARQRLVASYELPFTTCQ